MLRIKSVNPDNEPVLERVLVGEDMWKEPRFEGDHMDVHVRWLNQTLDSERNSNFSQKYLSFVESQLKQNDVDFEVMIEDLGDAVNESLKAMNTGKAKKPISIINYYYY